MNEHLWRPPDAGPPGRGRFVLIVLLFSLSGVAGLVFQVIWMYRLSLVFGNAAYATAATLAAFFLGLGFGGWLWGNMADRLRRPLAVYGLIEIGVALSALLLTPALSLYEEQYGAVATLLAGHRGLLVLAKFVFSTTLLLVPTFLMGGTFPVLVSYVAAGRDALASRGTLLYALNTLGASLGALVAAFYLLPMLGVTSAYLFAVLLAGAVGVFALLLELGVTMWPVDRVVPASHGPHEAGKSPSRFRDQPAGSITRTQVISIAIASGILTISAEILWTRMLAQVLQNSVYSFAAILVVFLISLGLGGLLSHGLVGTRAAPRTVLVVLLSLAAAGVGLTPLVFNWATDGLAYLAPTASWSKYLVDVFRLAILVVLPSTVVMGAVFPFLLKAIPPNDQNPGLVVGRLLLLNSLGSALGSLLVGFVLLDSLGLWSSIRVVAVAYGIFAAYLAFRERARPGWPVAATFPVLMSAMVMWIPSPNLVRLEEGERLLDTWQSSDGVVSVVEIDQTVQLRIDNFYALGDSRSYLVEQMQAHIPLLAHPDPSRVLFLGLGTGITTGASLFHNPDRIVATELVPNVVRAAQKYFSPWVNGLFEDPRVQIVADDARNFLLGTNESFDVIVGDLFTPWHAGTGSLYTLEHFRLVRRKLAPGGIFAQWLPLYQLTPSSFETIAATFAEVFPEVTVWRADFSGSRASIALMGQETGAKLNQEVLLRNSLKILGPNADSLETRQHMATLFYVGNLKAIRDNFSDVVLNTDERRTVELSAPITAQAANAGQGEFITGSLLEDFYTILAEELQPQEDPFLANLPAGEVRFAEVGLLYFRYLRLVEAGSLAAAREVMDHMTSIAPDFAARAVASTPGG